MIFTKLIKLATTTAAAVIFTATTTAAATSTPVSPPAGLGLGLTYLYNANITGSGMIFLGQGPRGTRIVAPITGGTFEGGRLKGKLLPVGADWAVVDANDPAGSLIAIEARHTLQTDDGAVIQVFERGSTQPDGSGFVSLSYETGHPDYYWLNAIVGVGIIRPTSDKSAELHAWHLTIEESKGAGGGKSEL